MLITKLHLRSHYLHPLIYIIQIQPLVQQRTTYFEIQQKTPLQKVWMTEKKSMLILHTMPSSKRKRGH
jgi:hypothetical protein